MDTLRSKHLQAALSAGMVLTLALSALVFHVAASGVASRLGAPTIPECSGARSIDFGCLSARYEGLTRSAGAEIALADLAQLSARGGYVGAACHQLSHVVGRTAGQLAGPTAFTEGSELSGGAWGVHRGDRAGWQPLVWTERTRLARLAGRGDHRPR